MLVGNQCVISYILCSQVVVKMDKRKYKVLDPSEPRTFSSSATRCVLCQEVTKNELVCPAGTSWGTGAGYKTLTDILRDFDKMDDLRPNLKLSRLDDGQGRRDLTSEPSQMA